MTGPIRREKGGAGMRGGGGGGEDSSPGRIQSAPSLQTQNL